MQNAIIVLGAVVGIVLGAWLAVYLFHDGSDAGLGVTALLGAMVGTLAGGYIGFRLSNRET